MTAKDFPVRTPYGYTGTPYSTAKPHRGNDRKTPTGTAVVIAGVTIGFTGNSGSYNGMTYEPHLHTQCGTDPACQNTVDPSPFEFLPGIVTATGTGPQWGKFVTIKTGNRYVAYCHLSEIKVKVGQAIGGNVDSKPDAKTVTEYFTSWEGRTPTKAEIADYTSKSWRYLADNLLKDTESEKKAVILEFEKYKKTQVDKAVKAVTVALS